MGLRAARGPRGALDARRTQRGRARPRRRGSDQREHARYALTRKPGLDPDVDLSVPEQLQELWGTHGLVLLAVAGGGVVGALARYAGGRIWPTEPGTFPATTFAINGIGCALIGIVVVLITDVWLAHRLVRPFLVTGILGGFTTFSTYSVDADRLLQTGHGGVALVYVGATLLVALWAVAGATILTRLVTGSSWDGSP